MADSLLTLATRQHFDSPIDLLRTETVNTRWMLSVVVALLVIANFAKQFF